MRSSSRWRFSCGFGVAIALAACSSSPTTQVEMDFTRSGGFYAAPFPSDDLLRPDGTVDLTRYPNPRGIPLVADAVSLLAGARGFARSGGVFFSLTGPLDPSRLPGVAETTSASSPLFLVDLDPAAPDRLLRYPLEVSFMADGGPFGAPNLLALLPLQGVPLRANETYAAVVLSGLRDAAGRKLLPAPQMAGLARGLRPAGMSATAFAAYENALTVLRGSGVDPSDVAGLAVFTTGDPAAGLAQFALDAFTRPLPTPVLPLQPEEVFDDYCVFHTTIDMPDDQSGTPPFTTDGGTWETDSSGRPIVQRYETSNLYVTVPRQPVPPAGFPAVVFIRTGGGGDRPLVDRGPQLVPGGPAITPGTGPALQFARAGFAGVSVDGPLGGLRNTTHGDEQFLIFNIENPGALRDNIRESALELVLLPQVLRRLSFDASSCPGVTGPAGAVVTFDLSHLVLMGHSMGATIAPLVLAQQPLFGAAILSGAGASWIENIVYKEKPVAVRPLAEALIGYSTLHRTLTETDPVLTLVQWAAESADPQVYGDWGLGTRGVRPQHVLVLQGIVDHYILPRIANATSLILGLDLGGTPLDATNPELDEGDETPVLEVLPLLGRGAINLPAGGNQTDASGRPVTRILVQNPGDNIEDGHEVNFQTDPPKHQYRCFLESSRSGTPRVPPPGPSDSPCP